MNNKNKNKTFAITVWKRLAGEKIYEIKIYKKNAYRTYLAITDRILAKDEQEALSNADQICRYARIRNAKISIQLIEE